MSINGEFYIGSILTANTAGLGGNGTISYQWKRGDSADAVNAVINGATGQAYTLTDADGGKYISVTVSRAGYNGSITSAAEGPVNSGAFDPNKVGKPVAAPAAGEVARGTEITLTTATSGAAIRYTTDGSEPSSTSGTVYSATNKPVINYAITLKAIAYKSGMTDSDILTASYTVPDVSNPGGPALELASNAQVYSITRETAVSGGTAYTGNGTVKIRGPQLDGSDDINGWRHHRRQTYADASRKN